MSMIASVLGRLIIAGIIIVSGFQKVVDPGGTAQMLEATHLPAGLALPIGVFEVIAGALLAIGLMTRLVAIVLAAFAGLTIFFFYNQFTDPLQGTHALKNLALIGGLLMVFAYGQVRGSYDHMRTQRKVHTAEVRAAHAEGKLEGATTQTTVVKDDL